MIQPERNTKSVSLPIQWQNLKSKPHLAENSVSTQHNSRKKKKEHKFIRREIAALHFFFHAIHWLYEWKRIVTISEHVGDATWAHSHTGGRAVGLPIRGCLDAETAREKEIWILSWEVR